MILTKNLADVQALAKRQPPGFLDFVTSRGTVENGQIILDDAAQDDIREKFPFFGQAGVFSLALVKASTPFNPKGYTEFLLSRGKIKDDFVILNNGTLAEFNRMFPLEARAHLIRLPFIDEHFKGKPKGMKEFVLAQGAIANDYFILSAEAYQKVRRVFSKTVSITYSITNLKASAHERPEGFLDQVLALAKIDGDVATLAPDKWRQLMKKFPPETRVLKYTLEELQKEAHQRPPGFADYVLSVGKKSGGTVIVEGTAVRDCNRKFPKPIKYLIAHLKEFEVRRPPGYVDYVLAHGKIEGDFVTVDGILQKKLQELFLSNFRTPPPEPTLQQMAANFTAAMADWTKAGFRTVERAVYEKRHTTCQACFYWDAPARGGLGKCRICGCTKFKLWLATTKCPDTPPHW